MALYILGPDSLGTCCDCASRPLPCDTCTPNLCSCSLHFPVDTAIYSTFAAAQAGIASNTAGCIIWAGDDGVGNYPTYTALAADNSTANTIHISASVATSFAPFSNFWTSVNLKAGATVTATFVITTSAISSSIGYQLLVRRCPGDASSDQIYFGFGEVDNTASISTSLTSTAMPDDNEYVVILSLGAVAATSVTMTVVDAITSTSTLTPNPPIALYGSGSGLQLQACPRLLLPLGTESSGDTYATKVAAQAVLDSINVSNCVGYATNTTGGIGASLTTFSATEPGATLSLAATTNLSGPICVGSVNVLVGKTISVAYTYNIGATGTPPLFGISVSTRFQDGTTFDAQVVFSSSSSGTGTITTPVTTQAGKYFLIIGASTASSGGSTYAGASSATFIISSNGTMTINPVQALYANGANCPSRLDCAP